MTARIDHARYTLRLRPAAAIPAAGAPAASHRHGILVVLRDRDGHAGFGEVAPLAGLHPETLDDVEAALPEVHRAYQQAAPEINSVTDVRRALSATPAAALASLCFGMEMAWLGLRSQQRSTVPARLLSATPASRVAVAGLFDGDRDDARRAVAGGDFTRNPAVKVKVGRRPLDEERAVIDALIEGLGEHTRLRLDGNRALSIDAVVALIDGFDTRRFEFLEEPLPDPTQLPALCEATGLAVALDETLREPQRDALHRAPGVAAWVLKPALHGGIAACLELASRARAAGIGCVISSCFESGLGLTTLAQLAAALPGRALAAGLGTDRWLAEDLIVPPFSSAAGAIAIDDFPGGPPPETVAALGLALETA